MSMRRPRELNSHTGLRLLAFLSLFFATIFLYRPLVALHTSYFYHEDDAHHFNRTVEMAQRHELNPRYFNKPALHFYLRMPIMYVSVLYERYHERINSIKEIRTRDPYGLAGYSYTPSHPNIVAWTRYVSVTWSALMVGITFLMLCWIKVSPWIAIPSALLVSLSPEVVRNSYIVGVDTLMALTCLLTAATGLRALSTYSLSRLLACSLLAGISCSAKYNAAPICIIPFALWWLCDRSPRGAFIALAAPAVGFLLGAPYSLISFDQFWKGVSYEAWHYAVAGHEGHSAARGWPQVVFYLQWLLSDGIGVGALVLALVGMCSLWSSDKKTAFLILSFPLAYGTLMVLQKAHFSRNMLVLVPFGAITAGIGAQRLFTLATKPRIRFALACLILLACLLPLQRRTFTYLEKTRTKTESRNSIIDWLTHERPEGKDVAVAGSLQLPIRVFSIPGVDAFDPSKQTIAQLIQAGYSLFVVPTELSHLDAELTEIIRSIPGNRSPQRVPDNPAISILQLKAGGISHAAERAQTTLAVTPREGKLIPTCSTLASESHCWVTSMVTRVNIPHLAGAHSFEVMSPWSNQTLVLVDGSGALIASVKLKDAGSWEPIPIPARKDPGNTQLILTISEVHSPQSRGLNSDPRRLGIAIRP